jgi:electron transfer flavoprotein beta subunit
MKILVCISKTPDTTAKIAFTGNNTKFDTNGVQWIINPNDEYYALIRAIECKEADPSVQIHLINVGGPDNDAILRKAFALGGDEATRVNAEGGDSFTVATQIAAVARESSFDLILLGKETIDYNGSSIGGMLAEMLGMPFISYATNLELSGNTAIVTREIEGGTETCETVLPLVISCTKGMAEQRIPNMRGIMAARTRPLKVTEPVQTDTLTEIVAFSLPPAKTGVKLVDPDNMDELVRMLKEDAKVI